MKTNIDDSLKNWAARKTPSADHLRELAARIAPPPAKSPLCQAEEMSGIFVPFRLKLAYAGLGAAVSLASVVLACWAFLIPWSSSELSTVANVGTISTQQMEVHRKLFGEMERLFADQLRWVSQSGGEISLGLESAPHSALNTNAPLAVQLTVVCRKIHEKTWTPVWQTDVLVRGEEPVEIVPDPKRNNKLALWLYPLADGKVAVDANFSLEAPIRLSTRNNVIVRQGVPREILAVQAEDCEYRVLQTVVPLNPPNLAKG